jgi:hypothetical protein
MLRRWIVQPIGVLSLAASAIADGQMDHVVRVTARMRLGSFKRHLI